MTVRVETPRVVLEPLVPAHARETFEPLLDERLYAYMPTLPPETLADLEAQYERWADPGAPPAGERWLNWLARDRRTRAPIGTLQATVERDVWTMAWIVFPSHAGRGLATEALRALVEALHEREGARWFAALVDERNAASRRVAEKAGFREIARRDVDDERGSKLVDVEYALEL